MVDTAIAIRHAASVIDWLVYNLAVANSPDGRIYPPASVWVPAIHWLEKYAPETSKAMCYKYGLSTEIEMLNNSTVTFLKTCMDTFKPEEGTYSIHHGPYHVVLTTFGYELSDDQKRVIEGCTVYHPSLKIFYHPMGKKFT